MLSAAAHLAVILILCWQEPPFLVKPVRLARGQGGSATPTALTFFLPQNLASSAPKVESRLSLPVSRPKKYDAKARKRSNVLEKEKPAETAEAGSPRGSALDGDSEGDDIRQGFAITFPPPKVSRFELPNGREGDVIVELTIDAQGTVVEEKVLQGMSQEIDEKVVAILRVWRFRPATRNGTPIPFKYDARFHFPS